MRKLKCGRGEEESLELLLVALGFSEWTEDDFPSALPAIVEPCLR